MSLNLSTTDVPSRSPDYRAENIADEIMLYSETKTEAVFLNQAAATVWMLCDSTNTVGDIIGSITDHYVEQPATVLGQEVNSALDELLSRSVITIL